MPGQRVLGRIRLSRITEESTSAARQRELIEQWAAMNEHTVIGWAEDLDVSGSVDPFETPALGRWLREDKSPEWDVLCAWKLDRVGRRAIPLNKLFGWFMDNDKTLVCVSDNIDLSTWVGRLVANVIAGVAEGELESIRERTKASRRKLLESGRWPGGRVPYWLRPVELEGGGWSLELNPGTAPIARRIIAELIDGSSVDGVAQRLDADGIPSPRGARWSSSAIWPMVQSKSLLGHATYEGETVRSIDGTPVLYADPLIDRSRWDELQAAVSARRSVPVRTMKTSPMSGVVVCGICELPLYYKKYNHQKTYRYYHCRDHRVMIPADDVETLVEETFLEAVGDAQVQERFYIPAETHQIELEEAVRAVDELTQLLGTFTSETMRKRLTEQLGAIDSRISELERLPAREAHWGYRETGETYRSVWESADVEGKRMLLLNSGITATFTLQGKTRSSGGALVFNLRIPDDVLQRLSKGE